MPRTALVPLVLVLLGLLAPACTPEEVAEAPPQEQPAVEEVRRARDALGEPAVTLAESVIAMADELDAARHAVPRGQEAQRALTALDTAFEATLQAADGAEAAAADVDGAADPAVGEAVAAVEAAVEEARAAVEAGESERAALVPLAEVDARLDAAVLAWDEPGSQSERREALAALADELDAVAEQARALEPLPPDCPHLWEQRPAWAQLLAERTRELAASATGEGGEDYDALRARFRESPYGEDRVAVDAEDRGCWEEASPVARARASAPEHVDALEAALNPQAG